MYVFSHHSLLRIDTEQIFDFDFDFIIMINEPKTSFS